jgi:hypothetical protein
VVSVCIVYRTYKLAIALLHVQLHLLAFEKGEAQKEENDRRVRAAVKHVVGNIFNDAPVNIRLGCYPKSSPKAGERLVLMTLNKLVISEQEKQSKNEGRSAAGFGPPSGGD